MQGCAQLLGTDVETAHKVESSWCIGLWAVQRGAGGKWDSYSPIQSAVHAADLSWSVQRQIT